jgi:GTPase SAR1 family protein
VLAKRLGCQFIETSAKQSVEVKEAFSNVVRKLRQISQSNVEGVERGEKTVQTQHILNTSNSNLVGFKGLFARYIGICVGQRGK